MPLANIYPDSYLGPLVTTAREAQAVADVALLGTLPAAWVERLVVLSAYRLVCMQSQKAPDDLFSSKLASYSKEFDRTLAAARQAQALVVAAAVESGAAAGGAGSFFTIQLHRA